MEGFLRQQLKRLKKRAHRNDDRLTMRSQLIAIIFARVQLAGFLGHRKRLLLFFTQK